MDRTLEKYLDIVDKHLKPLPASERADIIREIKSSMVEMETTDLLSAQEIIQRLGDPRELARAYLGDLITNNTHFSWRKAVTICAFYSLAGLSGIIVIPTLGIIAPVFSLCGILVPIAGLVKLAGYFFGFDLPFLLFQFGSYSPAAPMSFILSLFTGVILLVLGYGSWKLLLRYIEIVSKKKKLYFS
ncbi:MAG: DUF1700 domain-containing protein [Eubacteriales bacterium]|nr:DUF1700 domain-containing protein [Eubacteriales bacterium]